MKVGLIVAAGHSERFEGGKKQFALLAGKPLLSYSLRAFNKAKFVDHILLVVAESDIERARKDIVEPLGISKSLSIVPGGESRQLSVAAGLKACPEDTEYVWVHDGARPLTEAAQIDSMFDNLNEYDGLILASSVIDTVKRIEDDTIRETVSREALWLAQTPQLFHYSVLVEAHRSARDKNLSATDDAALVEALGKRVAILANSQDNQKVTTTKDMALVERLIEERSNEIL